MAPPKDIARSYPKRGLTADVGFRSEPAFVGDGSVEYVGTNGLQFDGDHTFVNGFSVAGWYWVDGTQVYNYAGFAGTTLAWGFPSSGTYLNFYQKATSTAHQTTGGTLTPKQWNHIAFTLSQDGLTVKAYENGVELTITQPSVAIVLPSLTNISEAGIASFQNASPGTPVTLPYGGLMANQIWYDGVLTQDEVRQLMRAPNYAVASTIVTPQFYFELFSGTTESTGNATTVEDRGTTTTVYGVKKPQLPRGLDLARGAAMARVYTGRAVDFDGSTDFLDMGTGVDKNYTTRSDQTTFSFWLNPDTTSTTVFVYQNRALIGGTDRKECNHQFLYFSNTIAFDGSGASIQVPASKTPVGQWSFICGVADSTIGVSKLYINGELFTTTSAAVTSANGNNFIIGGRNNAPLQIFNGQISNFKIFNVELTQAQVRELYHNPEMVIPTGVSASNLRRHYPLCAYNDTGGMGGRYEIDQGVEGVNGEYGGSPVMAFAQPVPCPQLGLQQSATRVFFQGAGAQEYVATVTAPGTTATLSGWILWGDSSRNSYIVSMGQVSTATDSLNIRINGSGDVTMWKGTEYDSGLNINEGEWNHIVVTTKSSSPYWRCWVNGVEASSPAVAPVTNISTGSLYPASDGQGYTANGFINDVAFWDAELDTSDVAALYNSGVQGMDVSTVQSSNLKGWWKADDLTTFKDYSGNGADAVQTGSGTIIAASFPENASGSTIVGDFSMKRKGVSVLNCFNDPPAQGVRTEIPEGAGLAPSLTDGHAVSVWYRNQKQDTTSANNGTLVTSGDTGTSNRFVLEALNGNSFRGLYGAITATSTATISDNDWHHYAMVLDVTTSPNPTVRLYLDGVAAGTATSAIGTTFPESLTYIGWMNSSKSGFDYGLKGPLACPRIYAFQLSENEIKQIYNADYRLIRGLDNE